MDVRALVIHVEDPIARLVILDAGTRLPGPHPLRIAAGEGLAWRGLAEDTAVELGADTVVVQIASAVDALAGRCAVARQLWQAWTKFRIDVYVQNLGSGVD